MVSRAGRIFITTAKVLLLAFVLVMVYIQLPELAYDIFSGDPIEIRSPDQLNEDRIGGAAFATVHGTPSVENAFVFERYGISFTYFTLEPYGVRMIVRTYDEFTQEMRNRTEFTGKLRPFDQQPFSYSIEDILMDNFGVEVPEHSFFLGLGDVPAIGGWQIGSFIFACLLFGVLFYFFFFFRRGRPKHFGPLGYMEGKDAGNPPQPRPDSTTGESTNEKTDEENSVQDTVGDKSRVESRSS